jgi:LacI family transcriptional regulator
VHKKHKVMILVSSSGSVGRGLLLGIAKYIAINTSWITYYQTEARRLSENYLKNWKIDGIIADQRELEKNKLLQDYEIPKIILISHETMSDDRTYITANSEAIGKMAAEYFLDRGFKQFAFCSYSDMIWSRERLASFRKRISEEGYKVSVFERPYFKSYVPWERDQKKMADWINLQLKPLAVLACNDDRGRHVLEACKLEGVKVPEEVAVMGIDNDEIICGLTSPPLSSISLDIEKIGYDAAELLDDIISKKSVKIKHLIITPTHVVVRQSTDIVAIKDLEIASALNFISNNTNRPLQVSEVAAFVNMSQRTLERKFKKSFPLSINDEIERMRMNVIKKHLLQTNISVTQIAIKLGFPGVEQMARFFRKNEKTSPREYRQKHTVHLA